MKLQQITVSLNSDVVLLPNGSEVNYSMHQEALCCIY